MSLNNKMYFILQYTQQFINKDKLYIHMLGRGIEKYDVYVLASSANYISNVSA